jgi:hypothetical protein
MTICSIALDVDPADRTNTSDNKASPETSIANDDLRLRLLSVHFLSIDDDCKGTDWMLVVLLLQEAVELEPSELAELVSDTISSNEHDGVRLLSFVGFSAAAKD